MAFGYGAGAAIVEKGDGTLRVYHFINRRYGLQNLRQRRLKVAMINELNDPFEFLGIVSGERDIRHAFSAVKNALAQFTGILCFSAGWRNPVLWSHYADGHCGLCLGFDVSAKLVPVTYTSKRFKPDMTVLRDGGTAARDHMLKVLATKFSHWRYEKEYRLFVKLEDREENGLYFVDFSDAVRLKQVIVGHNSTISRAELNKALGDIASDVEVWKARLAFRTFRVVRQRSEKLWK